MCSKELSSIKGGILCDEMGLGKTVQIIALLIEGFRSKRISGTTLILVPKSLTTQWVNEITRFSNLRTAIYETQHNKLDAINLENVDVVVATYSSLNVNCNLQNVNWARIVLDEGHCIRTKSTKLYQYVSSLDCHGPKWILTGTPIYNKM